MPTATIAADLLPQNGTAYTYGVDNLTVTVNPGVVVQSHNSNAVFSSHAGSGLINNGTIYSANQNNILLDSQYYGVYFQAGSNITNNADGYIGGYTGIFADQAPTTIVNLGLVMGLQDSGLALRTPTGTDVVKNFGEIYGTARGILAFANGGSNSKHDYDNHGVIRSDNIGIYVNSASVLPLDIDNFAGALIKGLDAGIATANLGRIILDNRGTVSGGLDFDANAADNIVNRGKILGESHLGPGNDIFNGALGTAGKVFGEDGIDRLTSGKGADHLNGGAGIDFLTGGRGKDTLTGGLNADRFDFNSLLDSVKGAKRDVITDFSRLQNDVIDLRTIDAKTGVAGNNAFHYIGGASFHDVAGELRCKNGIVQGDVNGDGTADFEIKVNLASLVSGDFFL